MKALKAILGILGVIVAIYLIMCLMGRADWGGAASMEMDAPAHIVYNKVSDLETWSDWGPWMRDDPDMEIKMEEQRKGKGASYSWVSKMGPGSLTILDAEPNKSMNTKLTFEGMGDSYGDWKFEETDGKTNVTWGMESEMEMPFLMRGMALFMESSEEMFTRGLASIKERVEKEAAEMPTEYRGYKVNTIDFPAKNYIAKREVVKFEDMTNFYATNLPAVAGGIMKAGGEMDGMPVGLFYKYDEEAGTADMAAGCASKKKMELEGFENIDVPAGKALAIDYFGGYDGSAEAHYAMDDYMKVRNIGEPSLVIEEYVTDPGTESDTSKWLTKIFYIMK